MVATKLLLLFSVPFLCDRTWALSCGDCNRSNLTETCGPPPSCDDIVYDVCGCCPLCAQKEGEVCGGPWNVLGTCSQNLTCHPDHQQSPQLGAGGYFSGDSWEPTGTCLSPHRVQLLNSECLKLHDAYVKFLHSRGRRDVTNATTPSVTSTMTTVTATTTDNSAVTTVNSTVDCARKPTCTPDGGFAPLQCDGCVGECWCVSRSGIELAATRGPYRTVTC